MKKIFSFLAAVLFAGSMMADVVTLDPATQTPQTTETDINLTIQGIGVAYHGTLNAASENNGVTTPADFRVFASQTLKLSSATNKIEKVVIAGKAHKVPFTLSADKGTVTTGSSYAEVTEKATLADPLVVVENIGANSVTLSVTKQMRVYKIEVTLGEASQGGGDPDPVVTPADTLTCAEAAEQALAGKTDEVIIKGYVTEMVEEWSSFKNVSFWMSDTKGGANTFEAYRVKCETAAEAPTVGALVWVKGNLTKYTKNDVTIPETKAGGTFGILAKGEEVAPAQNLGAKTISEFLELKNTKDTCILTGIVSNIANAEYGNFDLIDATDTVYVYGLLTPAGESKKFAELGVAENDTLTVLAIYNEYNGNPQAKNAIFVEVKKYVEPIEPVVEPAAMITFGDSAVEKGTWSNNAVFADKDSLLTLTLIDPEGKVAIDLNDANFGTAEEYVKLSSRLKTGGKSSSSKNYININVAKDGQLYIMARTGSNSATDRNVVITNGNDTVFNQLLLESAAVVVPLTDTTSTKVYPKYSASLNAGVTYRMSYPVNGVNFYGFDFIPEDEQIEGPTTCAEAAQAALSVENNNDLYNDGAEYTIEGYVTSIATAFNAQFGNISFWMADEANGGNVLEAYRAVCASAEDAPAVGDKVAVTGKLTKYNTTPEFAAGCTYVILEKSAPAQNLGEKTIAEFLALKNMKDTCILTGVVDTIVNTTYGNLYLSDATSQVYVYGVLTAEGESKQFESLDVLAGDTLTILAIYTEYNGAPQVKNGIFVSVARAERPEPETIVIDVDYAEAGLIATQGIWQLNLYKDYDAETEVITYPDLYIGIAIQDETKIAGTYSIDDETLAYVAIDLGPNKSVEAVDASDLVITYLGEGVYHYELEFVGDDRNTYILDVELETPAYDLEDENFTDITLTDEVIDAVDHTTMVVKAVKVIKNGEVLIERNGVRYNVSGQLIR